MIDERIVRLRGRIRDVPDFPKPGILFKDVTPLLGDGDAFKLTTDLLAERVASLKPELIVGIESRGFIFGAALAERLGLGFVPVRKPGKLPFKTTRETYALEYGTDALEMHDDGVRKGQRVLIVDDLLATGGTSRAAADLVKRAGGEVHALAFLIELVALNGRQRLAGETIHAVLQY